MLPGGVTGCNVSPSARGEVLGVNVLMFTEAAGDLSILIRRIKEERAGLAGTHHAVHQRWEESIKTLLTRGLTRADTAWGRKGVRGGGLAAKQTQLSIFSIAERETECFLVPRTEPCFCFRLMKQSIDLMSGPRYLAPTPQVCIPGPGGDV